MRYNVIIVGAGSAVGVEVDSGGDSFKVYCREINLCGGAINSPQLLTLTRSWLTTMPWTGG